jgi:transcription initiation factor IIF auxiliary subunit
LSNKSGVTNAVRLFVNEPTGAGQGKPKPNLSQLLRVKFGLHETLGKKEVVRDKPPFHCNLHLWGTFTVPITLEFNDGRPPLTVIHDIEFCGNGGCAQRTIEVPSVPAASSALARENKDLGSGAQEDRSEDDVSGSENDGCGSGHDGRKPEKAVRRVNRRCEHPKTAFARRTREINQQGGETEEQRQARELEYEQDKWGMQSCDLFNDDDY